MNSEPSRSIHAGFVLYRRNDAIEAASIASFRLAGFVLYRRNDAIESYPIASHTQSHRFSAESSRSRQLFVDFRRTVLVQITVLVVVVNLVMRALSP